MSIYSRTPTNILYAKKEYQRQAIEAIKGKILRTKSEGQRKKLHEMARSHAAKFNILDREIRSREK